MFRGSIIVWVLIVSLTGVVMFLIKHEVQVLDARLEQLHQDILAHQESTLILTAEWSYLNQPARIEALARKYVAYRPTETNQIKSLADFSLSRKFELSSEGR
tara:strand:- start:170 stop:475 length:306 start_codon:yes stop_codon:yes gene_type:complete